MEQSGVALLKVLPSLGPSPGHCRQGPPHTGVTVLRGAQRLGGARERRHGPEVWCVVHQARALGAGPSCVFSAGKPFILLGAPSLQPQDIIQLLPATPATSHAWWQGYPFIYLLNQIFLEHLCMAHR